MLVGVLGGCATQPTQQDVGMVIGGGLGALLGSSIGAGEGRVVASVLGTLVGAVIGGAVGRSMDDLDRMKANHALETVRTGVSSNWYNPDTGNEYAVVPTRTYDTASGPCREYVMDAIIGGRKERVYGTACRQADGSWRTAG
ncbi:MAG: glycine zipper 2TM domain-containing protein [Gammaproteobacteria bacterium]|nr:glycine zipper 2TM domain-containing protein [Gammaproteobacteria bacterium]